MSDPGALQYGMAFFLCVGAGSEEEKLPGTQQVGEFKFSDVN